MAGLVGVTAITGGLCLTGCNDKDKETNDTDSAIRQVYASAVEAGYKGTYEEWLASIKGEKGDKGDKGESGKSAYEIYLGYKVNYTGSEVDWLNDMISGRLMLVVTENVGDVNGDGEVDTVDASIIQRWLEGKYDGEINEAIADVDSNGVVDYRDAKTIQAYTVHKLDSLPLAHKWGDINLDGKVDEADYNLLNNEEGYNSLTDLQKYLGTFGYDYSREEALPLFRQYLDGDIESMAPSTSDIDNE